MAWTTIPIEVGIKELLKEYKGKVSYSEFINKLFHGVDDTPLMVRIEKLEKEQTLLAKRLLKLEEIAHGYQ